MKVLDNVLVIIPKKHQEGKIEIKREKNISNWAILDFTMRVAKQKSSTNNISLSNRQLTSLLNTNNYIKCETSEIYEAIINIGNQLNEKIYELQKNKEINFYGKDRIDKIFKKYRNDIIDNNIDYECKKFCKAFSYIPFEDEEDNYLKFCIFIYHTFELGYISTYFNKPKGKNSTYYDDEKTLNRRKEIINYLHNNYFSLNNKEIDEIILERYEFYTEKYSKYDKVRFCLIDAVKEAELEKKTYSDEIFDMVIATEELLVPIIWETKNILCNMFSDKTYAICDEPTCHNLYRKNGRQQYCTGYECSHKRERDRKNKS